MIRRIERVIGFLITNCIKSFIQKIKVMLVVLEIAALIAIIVLPLAPAKKSVKG